MKKKILHLTLSKKWFDFILSGKKTQEFREVKKHWISRFCGKGSIATVQLDDVVEFAPKDYDEVHFTNGYGKDRPFMIVEFISIELQRDIECPLGRGDYFVINLGKVLESKNV